ncbi:uncharacterized protein LOC119997044 [Tripterygium wilfordii]|uniref:uncharacterized protein LOC119997044 n=1 Tax=Tripterygium wilfordii TaxID=458696 RepID=UPI0018F86151|nr:uncharacterized protein LOC119997044 [Tripterygium wilfordii]
MGKLIREQWEAIRGLKSSILVPWLIWGDLNEVLLPEDRLGGTHTTNGMNDFGDFVNACNLVELPLAGRRFTWSNSRSMSRIDRTFVDTDWLFLFPNIVLQGLSKGLSDHCPLLFTLVDLNWGPRPFKFLNCWWDHPDFRQFVCISWAALSNANMETHSIVTKLKLLKQRLKDWNHDTFGNINDKLKSVEADLDRLDKIKETRDLDSSEDCNLRYLRSSLWSLSKSQESLWRQKSNKTKGSNVFQLYSFVCVTRYI